MPGLDLVVRSHDVPSDNRGYAWHHNRTLATVFSASNYQGHYGNTGAVMLLCAGARELAAEEHDAGALADVLALCRQATSVQEASAALQRHTSVARDEAKRLQARMLRRDLRRRVAELVVQRRAELFEHFSARDRAETGAHDFNVSRDTWVEACRQIVHPGVPWERVLPLLQAPEEREWRAGERVARLQLQLYG